jgi:formamidopyrimidine-DNA glycosylase
VHRVKDARTTRDRAEGAVPELPEVETVRAGLEHTIVDKEITSVEIFGHRTVRRQEPAEFVQLLTGRTVVQVARRGKYLLLPLDDGAVLVGHLRMSGQLRYLEPPLPAHELHTHAIVAFGTSGELRFVDPRTFGELFVTDALDARGVPQALSTIGIDPLVDGVDAALLARRLATRHRALKAFLLDQSEIAGIGNIYADEICFVARLSPERRTETITRREAGRLTTAITEVLDAAVLAGGSSLVDAGYRDLLGELGRYQERHAVYGRAGAPCPRCATPIVRSVVGGRSAHRCPRCQR